LCRVVHGITCVIGVMHVSNPQQDLKGYEEGTYSLQEHVVRTGIVLLCRMVSTK